MTQSDLEEQFALAWRLYGNGIVPEREYKFAKELGRLWRFDFAFPGTTTSWGVPIDAPGVGVEIDGGQYAFRGGRHATDADREKLNTAAALGWRVLRFSGSMLKDPEACCKMVKWALEYKDSY